MNVLEEFWYGNLDPAEYDANTSKEYKEIVRLISIIEIFSWPVFAVPFWQ